VVSAQDYIKGYNALILMIVHLHKGLPKGVPYCVLDGCEETIRSINKKLTPEHMFDNLDINTTFYWEANVE
jgi:NADPH-dependent ferric siderophore reductase